VWGLPFYYDFMTQQFGWTRARSWPVAYPAIEHTPAIRRRPQWEREILRDCLRRLFPHKDESQLNGAGSIQKELGDKVSSR